MARLSHQWRTIRWDRPAQIAGIGPQTADQNSLREAIQTYGSPSIPNTTPLEEAKILLSAGSEIEHAPLVQYLYTAWSLGGGAIAPRVREIAIQEMCHFITVQNWLLFTGAQPLLDRQDQDPSPMVDPFPFSEDCRDPCAAAESALDWNAAGELHKRAAVRLAGRVTCRHSSSWAILQQHFRARKFEIWPARNL